MIFRRCIFLKTDKNRNLNDNQLTGPIPLEIGNINGLHLLYIFMTLCKRKLHNNQLNGSIPSSIGNLNRLIGLYIFMTNVKGIWLTIN